MYVVQPCGCWRHWSTGAAVADDQLVCAQHTLEQMNAWAKEQMPWIAEYVRKSKELDRRLKRSAVL